MKQLFILCVLAAQFINVNAQNLTKISQFHLVDEKGNRITPLLSSIEDFDDAGNAVYSVGGNANSWGPIKGAKYGIMNNKGRIVLPATYEFLDKFSYDNDSLYKFGKGESRGLIDLAGKELIPAMFKYINKIYYTNSVVSAEMENDYTRLYSFDGKPLTPLYQSLRENEKNYHFKINGYEGYMDHKFKEIIKPEFVKCEELKNGTFLVQDKSLKAYILSKNGTPIFDTKYDEIDVEYGSDYETIQGYTITESGKEGFCDPTFKVILDPEFRGLNRISFGCDNFIFSAEKNRNEYYLYGQTGKLLSKSKFKYIDTYLAFDKYIIGDLKAKEKKKKKDDEYDYYSEPNKYTLLNLQGKAVLNQTFEDYKTPYSYSNETLLLLKIKGAWAAYNEQLELVFNHPKGSQEKFTYMESLGDGLYSVQIGGKDEGYGKPEGGVYGIYNDLGEEILPLKYEDIEASGYGNDKVLLIKKNGRFGIHDITGKLLVDHLYTSIDRDDEFCIVEDYIEKTESRRFGLISTMNGQVKIPVKYGSLTKVYSTDYYVVTENNKCGILNNQGTVVTPIKYNYLESASLDENKDVFYVNAYGTVKDGYYGLEVEGGNWGVITTKGDTLIPVQYSKISFINDTVVQLTDLDKNTYLAKFPSLMRITNQQITYMDKLGYSYENPKFLIGKDVTLGEYGDPQGGLYGITDLTGAKISDCKYSEIEEENDHYICNYADFNGYDLLDEKGNILIQQASTIQRLTDTVFIVQKDGSVSLFNVNSRQYNTLNGAIEYSAPERFYRGAVIGIKSKNDKWGAINEQGDWIIKPQYCDIIGSDDNYLIVGKCEGVTFRYGVINLANEILIPLEYDSVDENYGNEFKCVLGNKLYTKNLSNETLEVENATDENIRD